MKKTLFLIFQMVHVLMYLGSICLWVIIPEELTLNICLTVFALCLTSLYMILERERLGRFVRSFWFKNFSSDFISATLILALLGLLNYMAVKHPWEKDFTHEKLFSLSPQSLSVVKNLKEPILMEVYARKELGLGMVQFLKRYSMANSLIQITLVDPDLNPRRAQEFQITQEGQVVVSSLRPKASGTPVMVSALDELSITNALIKLSRTRAPLIAFITGHSEMSLEDNGREGLSELKKVLSKGFYETKKINLLQAGKIEQSIDTVVVWSPKEAFAPQEIQALKTYAQGGGRLIVGLMPEFNTPKQQGLRNFLRTFGLNIPNNLVLDPESFVNGSQGAIPLVTQYEKHHLITQNFAGQTFFPFTSAFEASETVPENMHFSPLLFTSEKSFSKLDFLEIGKGNFSFNQKTDVMGPHILAASLEQLPPLPQGQERGMKIVAFGNATFIANMYFGQGKNFDLFLNSLSYTTEEAALLALDRPSDAPQRLVISAPHYRAVVYFSVLLGPLLFIVMAIAHYRRRHVGARL